MHTKCRRRTNIHTCILLINVINKYLHYLWYCRLNVAVCYWKLSYNDNWLVDVHNILLKSKCGPTVFIQTADTASHIQALTSASVRKKKTSTFKQWTTMTLSGWKQNVMSSYQCIEYCLYLSLTQTGQSESTGYSLKQEKKLGMSYLLNILNRIYITWRNILLKDFFGACNEFWHPSLIVCEWTSHHT